MSSFLVPGRLLDLHHGDPRRLLQKLPYIHRLVALQLQAATTEPPGVGVTLPREVRNKLVFQWHSGNSLQPKQRPLLTLHKEGLHQSPKT